VAALPSSSQVPVPHETGSTPPPAQYVPGSQAAHWTGEVAVAAAVWRWPAAQAPAGLQAVAFASALYSAAPQATQVRSAVAVPAESARLPGTQSVHAVQALALVWPLNLPLSHGAHTRSVRAVPAVATYWPAGQSLQGAQAVAALPSSSQVPVPHATGSTAPPAQKVPGSQAAHWIGEVAVTAVCRWPAAQAPAELQALALNSELY
jgi:hypothetical protein